MRKLILYFFTILSAALIVISVYNINSISTNPTNQTENIEYIVKDYSGKIAVFVPDENKPIAVYEVYTHLLSENDIELLRKGISINDDFQLIKALEDFGL